MNGCDRDICLQNDYNGIECKDCVVMKRRQKMIEWNKERLENNGYTIENAVIKSVDLSMAARGYLVLTMELEGDGWGCVYGGDGLGKGFVGASKFEGSKNGIEYLMRIMNIVECDTFNQLEGKYVRVAAKGWGGSIKIIGNPIKDKWFDAKSFFEEADNDK